MKLLVRSTSRNFHKMKIERVCVDVVLRLTQVRPMRRITGLVVETHEADAACCDVTRLAPVTAVRLHPRAVLAKRRAHRLDVNNATCTHRHL